MAAAAPAGAYQASEFSRYECDGGVGVQELWGLAAADTLSVIQMFASVSMLVPVTSPQGPRWHVANLAQVRPLRGARPAVLCRSRLTVGLAAGARLHWRSLQFCISRDCGRAPRGSAEPCWPSACTCCVLCVVPLLP